MQQHVRHVPDEAGESLWVAGDTYTFKATADDTGGSLAFFDAAVPPGSGPPPHAHRDEDEFYYVLDGELEVLDRDRTFTARAGCLSLSPGERCTPFCNRSAKPARLVVGITPAGFERFFFAVGQQPVPGGQPPPPGPDEMARALELAPRFGLEIAVS